MKRKSLAVLLLLFAMLVPSAAFAEGYAVYEWSAAGSGMGEAYMFGENDPAVLAYNPAAITRFDGAYASIGASLFLPYINTKFNTYGPLNRSYGYGNSGSVESVYSTATAPYLYYATKAGKNSWFGIAEFSRFGNNVEYSPNWPGRYDTIFAGIKGFTIQPTYAWKMGSKWAAAVGLDINCVMLNLKSAKPLGYNPPYTDEFFNVDGTSYSLGGVLSVMYNFDQNTSAGLVYHTAIKHNMAADTDVSSLVPGVSKSTTARGSVTLPDSFEFGLSHKFNQGRTRVEFDAIWTNWTTYDALDLAFDDPVITARGLTYANNSQKDWNAAWRFNLGIEHKLSDQWSILGGYVYDQSPVPDERMDFTVPTGDRHRISCGLKYRPKENQEWSLAYTAIWPVERTVHSGLSNADFNSATTCDGLTQVIGLGYTIKLK
jgi:long-chain fatty acid transport protein